jgi:hypothetical protein
MRENNMISPEIYIAVLEAEVATLLSDYYKPYEEGTGHFNTAASVLQYRIDLLKSGK